MSNTKPIEAHHVKKGTNVMLKGRPCKAVDVKTSKTGKHGHAKCNITGIDVLTSKKYNEVHPGHIVLATFDVDKIEYEVSDIDEKEMCLKVMDEAGEEETIDYTNETMESVPGWKNFVEDFQNDASEKIWLVCTMTAPVGETDPPLVSVVSEVKEGKE